MVLAAIALSLALSAAPGPVRASLDFSQIAAADFERWQLSDLYKSLLVRLMQAGTAVVDNPGDADLIEEMLNQDNISFELQTVTL